MNSDKDEEFPINFIGSVQSDRMSNILVMRQASEPSLFLPPNQEPAP